MPRTREGAMAQLTAKARARKRARKAVKEAAHKRATELGVTGSLRGHFVQAALAQEREREKDAAAAREARIAERRAARGGLTVKQQKAQRMKERAERQTQELYARRGVEELRCGVCGGLLLTLTCRACGTKAPHL